MTGFISNTILAIRKLKNQKLEECVTYLNVIAKRKFKAHFSADKNTRNN